MNPALDLHILSLFPEMFAGPFGHSQVKKAQEKSVLNIHLHDLRRWGIGHHQVVDDRPFGGGKGMVLRVDVVDRALNDIDVRPVLLTTPQGELFNHDTAADLAGLNEFLIICGHYEGVDERIREFLVDQEISIGDYVLSGGEIPAMVITDAVSRLLPGVLDNAAVSQDSFADYALEHPHYTRPRTYQSHSVPPVLLSGDHQKINEWRRQKAEERTRQRRPDLI